MPTIANTIHSPERIAKTLSSRSLEVGALYVWAHVPMPNRMVSGMLIRSPMEATTADMSTWPAELDAESRAIHRDFAAASFRALSGD